MHDFCPGAKSLRELFLDAPGPLLPESTLWSYVCQLVTMLRGVHAAGLACRCIDSTHVLVTGHNRYVLVPASRVAGFVPGHHTCFVVLPAAAHMRAPGPAPSA